MSSSEKPHKRRKYAKYKYEPRLIELRRIARKRLRRNPGAAALMSLMVMGLGQIYAGCIDRGIILLIIHIAAVLGAYSLAVKGVLYDALAPICSSTLIAVFVYAFGVVFIVLWIYNIKDAYYRSLFSDIRDWFEMERMFTGAIACMPAAVTYKTSESLLKQTAAEPESVNTAENFEIVLDDRRFLIGMALILILLGASFFGDRLRNSDELAQSQILFSISSESVQLAAKNRCECESGDIFLSSDTVSKPHSIATSIEMIDSLPSLGPPNTFGSNRPAVDENVPSTVLASISDCGNLIAPSNLCENIHSELLKSVIESIVASYVPSPGPKSVLAQPSGRSAILYTAPKIATISMTSFRDSLMEYTGSSSNITDAKVPFVESEAHLAHIVTDAQPPIPTPVDDPPQTKKVVATNHSLHLIKTASSTNVAVNSDADWENRRVHAVDLYLAGRWEDALTDFLICLKEREDPELYDKVGAVFQRLGSLEDAYEAFRRASQLGYGDALFKARVGNLAADLGKWQDGIEYLSAALAQLPHRIDLRLQYARCLNGLGQGEAARNELIAIIQEPNQNYSVKRRAEQELARISNFTADSSGGHEFDLQNMSNTEAESKILSFEQASSTIEAETTGDTKRIRTRPKNAGKRARSVFKSLLK